MTHSVSSHIALRRLRSPRPQRGMSLVELMVSMVIGLIVVLAGVLVYVASNAARNATLDENRMEDSSRYLVGQMAQEIRQAGFLGCQSRGGSVVNLLNGPPFWGNFAQPVYGMHGTGTTFSPALDGSFPTGAGAPDPRSDVLTVRSLGSETFPVLPPYPAADGSGAISIPATTLVQQGMLLAVSNCVQTTVFQNTSPSCTGSGVCSVSDATGTGAPGNSRSNLGAAFRGDAEVLLPTTTSWFVALSSRCQAGAPSVCPTYSLWRKINDQPPEELLVGVERLAVHYGVDTVGNSFSSSQSMTADQVNTANAWAHVVSVDVQALLTSLTPNAAVPQSVVFNGQTINGGTVQDRKVRRAVTITVGFRNLVP